MQGTWVGFDPWPGNQDPAYQGATKIEHTTTEPRTTELLCHNQSPCAATEDPAWHNEGPTSRT